MAHAASATWPDPGIRRRACALANWHTPRVPLGRVAPPTPPVVIVSVRAAAPAAGRGIDRRIAAFQAGLQRDGIDAALIVDSADLVYLSGTAQNAHLIVPAVGESLLLVRRDLDSTP